MLMLLMPWISVITMIMFESKQFEIFNIPPNYRFYTPDIFIYTGEDANLFDHINIKVIDYLIIS